MSIEADMFEDFDGAAYVLILGAGLMQEPAIMAAKKNGFKAVVVDGNPNAVGVAISDAFSPVDLKDKEGLLAFAKTIPNLQGVFTAGTDFSASVAYVANKLGLFGHNYEACLNASNKVRMRTCFESKKVPSPAFEQVSESDIAKFSEEKLSKMIFPKVVKPVDNMGARGCRMIRSKEEFFTSVSDAVKNSRSGSAILENYMEGAEFSIDSIVYNGTLTITGFADRHICYPPYFIEVGHSMPTQIDWKTRRELLETFARGVSALGLTSGAAKGDIKYTKDGAMIGEIAARLSGGYMSGWTYPYSADINLTEQALLIAVGKEPKELLQKRVRIEVSEDCPFEIYDLPCVKSSVERAWISIPGTIKEIYGLEKAKKIEGVKDVFPRNKIGDNVDFPRNNVQKCGNVITVAKSFSEAQKIAQDAIRSITIRLNVNNKETETFLSGKERGDEKGFPPCAYPSLLGLKWHEEVKEKIREDESVISLCPSMFLSCKEEDWNYNTVKQALELFDRLCPKHKEIDSVKFFEAMIRGGIQGCLYVADCANSQ